MEIKKLEIDAQGLLVNGVLKWTLEEMTEMVNENRIKNKDEVILKIEWESNRNFDGAYEYTLLPKAKAIKAKELLTGINVHFGEIAGKHSDIYGDIEEDEITIVTDLGEIKEFKRTYPDGLDYNHSFLGVISDYIHMSEFESLGVEEEDEESFKQQFEEIFN